MMTCERGIDGVHDRLRIAVFNSEQANPADGFTPFAQCAWALLAQLARNQCQATKLGALVWRKTGKARHHRIDDCVICSNRQKPDRQLPSGLRCQRSCHTVLCSAQDDTVTAGAGFQNKRIFCFGA